MGAHLLKRSNIQLIIATSFIIFGTLMMPGGVFADGLSNIRERGYIIVGVKRDTPPWSSQIASTGKFEGMEPDLALDLARRLGVRLELVGLLTIERIPALQSGKVDVLIATFQDTPERAAEVNFVLPHYYSSGVNVVARRRDQFKSWDDLRGRKVCGRHGASYNRLVTLNQGIDIVKFYNNDRPLAALRDGRCDALIHYDPAIVALLSHDLSDGQFEMPLPTLYARPWGLAIRTSERGGMLEKAISDSIVSWHRDGFIKRLENKWSIPAIPYVSKMHEQWRLDSQGRSNCGTQVTNQTPKECL